MLDQLHLNTTHKKSFFYLKKAMECCAVDLPDTFNTTTDPGKKLRKWISLPFSLIWSPHN